MIKMKKALLVFAALLLLLPMAGCGVKQKLADKVAEKVTEGIAENIFGEDVDLDLDGDKVTVKGDDGSEWTMGGGEWPREGAATIIPEFKKGTIVSVINTPAGCWISLEEVELADYKMYVETLKQEGFDQNITTSESAESLNYYAVQEGVGDVATNFVEDGTMTITVSLAEEE